MILFLFFVVVPLIEIGLFITVGDEIGILMTLLLCVLTAMIGAALIRAQGLATLFSARSSMEYGKLPVSELFDGLCIAIAGALLMTPGFFTDAVGFSLLVPQIREKLRHYGAAHFNLEIHGAKSGFQGGYDNRPGSPRDPNIIDVEYETIESDDRP